MASRGRVALIAAGLTVGVIALFLGTVWLMLTALEEGGLPGRGKVAIVEVEGIIGVGASGGVDTDAIVRMLGEHRDNPSVAAVVLRVNSPGGVVAPTQEIFAAVERVRAAGKPVVASMGSVAASGGYYVAVAANRVYANPGTLTGSIGVVMQLANVEGLLKKVGVDYIVVKAGRYKDIGNIARPMKPEERQVLQALSMTSTDSSSRRWRSGAASTRRRCALRRRAHLLGATGARPEMVDEMGGLEDAIEAAAKLAGIVGRPKLIYPRRGFSLRNLVQNRLGLDAAAQVLPALPALFSLRTPLYLMQ